MVPSSYCLCSFKEEINEATYRSETKHSFEQSGELVVDFINEMTDAFRHKCQLFALSQIKSVKKIRYTVDIVLYNVQLVLMPGET